MGGHTEADLSTSIFSLLPVPEGTNLQEQYGAFDATTEAVYAAYQAQEEFCISNAEAVDSMNAELQSGEISAATFELMELSMFEVAVFLENATPTSSRRNLFFSNFDWPSLPLVGPLIGWSSAIESYFDPEIYMNGMALGGWNFGGFGRRQLKNRLLNQAGASRRALTDGNVMIPTMAIVSGCSNEIPSFVCSLSTSDLTEILASQICGGSGNLASCDFSTDFALGYLSALGN